MRDKLLAAFSGLIILSIVGFIIWSLYQYLSPWPLLSTFSLPFNRCDLKFGFTDKNNLKTFKKDACLSELGIEFRDTEICKKISYNSQLLANCITKIAVMRMSHSVCDQIAPALLDPSYNFEADRAICRSFVKL